MSTRETDVFLSLHDLRKAYGELEAVRNLSLDVLQGEVFGFLGPNGAGKTTTIRMACGLLQPDGGEIRVDGDRLRDNPAAVRKRIGLCPQEIVIWETLTCLEQLTFVGTQYDLSRAKARRRGSELLGILGLSEKANRLAKTLSGGMKRRLNLALALVHDPDLLILDEPQAGLDPQSRIMVREFIQSLAASKTVLLTTHEMDEADRTATRVGIIDHGRLLVLDTPKRLKEHHAGGEVLEVSAGGGAPGVGSWPETSELDSLTFPEGLTVLESLPGTMRLAGPGLQERVPEVLETLRNQGVEPTGITLRKPTLEDVFISLTGRGLRE